MRQHCRMFYRGKATMLNSTKHASRTAALDAFLQASVHFIRIFGYRKTAVFPTLSYPHVGTGQKCPSIRIACRCRLLQHFLSALRAFRIIMLPNKVYRFPHQRLKFFYYHHVRLSSESNNSKLCYQDFTSAISKGTV